MVSQESSFPESGKTFATLEDLLTEESFLAHQIEGMQDDFLKANISLGEAYNRLQKGETSPEIAESTKNLQAKVDMLEHAIEITEKMKSNVELKILIVKGKAAQ